MTKTGKLELTWVGKYDLVKIEPRILIEDISKSNIKKDSLTKNMLIHGDNLLALKALENDFAGKIKCVYIDPPYNTGSAFTHYDDGVEHSIWLGLMKSRLEILRNLLADEGTMWISIDADESHYLKVLCDEIFGRTNFIDEIVWQRSYAPINLKKTLSRAHDTILVYAKKFSYGFELNKLPRHEAALARYKNPDNDPRGLWQSDNLWVGPRIESNVFEIITPSGRVITPPAGYSSRLNRQKFQEYIDDNRIWFGENGNNTPRIKRFLSEVKSGITPMTWWTREEVGDSQQAKREIKALFIDDVFDTPKSEKLIERIITIASNEGDYVLDSFLGSGTTTAVAHKMKRNWIGIELGNHAYTHCKLRMDKVIDGEQGGISKSNNWIGGGGYRFYELAPSLLVKHATLPIYQINKEYSFDMLCEAICKLEGFKYQPEGEMHGRSSESRFIHISSELITGEYIKNITKELGENDSAIIYGTKIQSNLKLPVNIEVKRIPKDLLEKYEFESEVR